MIVLKYEDTFICFMENPVAGGDETGRCVVAGADLVMTDDGGANIPGVDIWSKRVHDALRIPLQTIEDQAQHIVRLSSQNGELRRESLRTQQNLEEMRQWGWLRRLKFFVLGR